MVRTSVISMVAKMRHEGQTGGRLDDTLRRCSSQKQVVFGGEEMS